MKLSTNNSLIGKISDSLGINKKFHQYKETNIDPMEKALISPVEGKIAHIGNINADGMLISKNNKKIGLKELIGENCKKFKGDLDRLNRFGSKKDRNLFQGND